MKAEIKREKSDNIMKTKIDVKRIKVRLYFVSNGGEEEGGIQKQRKRSDKTDQSMNSKEK